MRTWVFGQVCQDGDAVSRRYDSAANGACASSGGGTRPDPAARRYCDLAGLRAIISVTGGDPAAGPGPRSLVLRRVPPASRTALGILGWDTAPGLVLERPGATGPAEGG